MQVGHIQGATRVLNAPSAWDRERDGACGSLPVRDTLTTAGNVMTSAWFPTPQEVDAIAKGAPIYLTVFGILHPVVALGVGEAPSESS